MQVSQGVSWKVRHHLDFDQIWASAPQPAADHATIFVALSSTSELRQHACASSHSVSAPRLVLTG